MESLGAAIQIGGLLLQKVEVHCSPLLSQAVQVGGFYRAETERYFDLGCFGKGCEFLLVSLGEGLGVGVRVGCGGGFPVEMGEAGEGGGEGGGGWVWTGKTMSTRLSKRPFSKVPFSGASPIEPQDDIDSFLH